MELLVGAIIVWIVPIFLANAMGKPKNRAGLAYGLFLGWIGVICLALLPPREQTEREPLREQTRRAHEDLFG
jgi:hypothetical protein